MLKAGHIEGRVFREDELATSDNIDHGMTCIGYFDHVGANGGMPVDCECSCPSDGDHNTSVHENHPEAYLAQALGLPR